MCSRCLSDFQPRNIRLITSGVRGLAIYEYNQAVKSALFRFKGCFDYELKDVFLDHQAPVLRLLYPGYSIVPVPSSKNHDHERGFNHVREMFSCLCLPMIQAIEKTDDRKQSDLDYLARQEVGEHLRWRNEFSVNGKKILLVDDVYTTGATIRSCIKLLKKHGASKIRVLVMAKTKGPHEPS